MALTRSKNDTDNKSSRLAAQKGGSDNDSLTGTDKVAALLLALNKESGTLLLKELEESEVRQITLAISQLSNIDADEIDHILTEFASQLLRSGAVIGGANSAEKLLTSYLAPEKVANIMEEVRGPAGRNMWEKLSNVQEQVLANYLRNEYPQTIAVVLSRISPDHAARVLALLPEETSFDVVNRMLRLGSVQKDVLDKIEQTLRLEFMATFAHTRRRDAYEQMAEVFNSFDRQTEARFMSFLEDESRDDAERIRSLMFTFDDLVRLDNSSVQTLLQRIDKDKLPIALKGAKPPMRDLFFDNMSERAAKQLLEDMEVMGPVRLKEVDAAQADLVTVAKDLASSGEIVINKNNSDDELIY
ncbi:hypothetical protein CAPTEDRAFT_147112 [Capitella teleta]|uniref:Flagellar motor switch protein FliG n=1 Tax=Capitella teleta TaxID=283909 RepID=R7UDR6_CAPTE|nr:hypothetical protein CAPTEDRAFT_147112 [Capitella teleta]|eukprot:ELU04251.1 hypothetical protein CAPTEDRAFT_147112 [Capitella teleta]